jgi:hypothetical protein
MVAMTPRSHHAVSLPFVNLSEMQRDPLVIVPVNALMDRFKPEESIELRKRDCPKCLSKIPFLAERCAFCTADIGSADVPRGVRAEI